MLLAIDVGNSETKLGFFSSVMSSASPERTWRVTTVSRRTADEYGVLFAALFRRAEIPLGRVRAIAISSVVPSGDAALAEACEHYFNATPLFITAATQSLIDVATERPRELGSDLLSAAIGAKERYGTPLVAIGYGTATTFSAVSREGAFIGAAIAPGIRISVDALIARAAKLPQVALEVPNGPIGRETVSSLQSGIVFGFVGQTEGIVARFRAVVGEDATVVATGGLADVIARHTTAIDAVEPHLVLLGLRKYYSEHSTDAARVV